MKTKMLGFQSRYEQLVANTINVWLTFLVLTFETLEEDGEGGEGVVDVEHVV